ncbi:MAG: hypothetical protein RL532_774, partial [Actinomycetota bacterium]
AEVLRFDDAATRGLGDQFVGGAHVGLYLIARL